MPNTNFNLITFKSVAYAMRFEKIMKEHNINIKIIPVPRSLSTSCGMCARFDIKDKETILRTASEESITYEKCYEEW